jgi:septal ring factor EnvC (AmiA/AmiB activator)
VKDDEHDDEEEKDGASMAADAAAAVASSSLAQPRSNPLTNVLPSLEAIRIEIDNINRQINDELLRDIKRVERSIEATEEEIKKLKK